MANQLNTILKRNTNGQKHMKKCSISLSVKEMQIKTTLRFLFTLVRMASQRNSRCCRGCWVVVVGEGTHIEVPQKTKNRATI
jgi:hypothetical protein